MLKKTILSLLILSIYSFPYCQDVKKENEQIKTKMDVFASKTGVLSKYIDTKLPILKTTYEGAETRIRKIANGQSSAYFYQITKTGKYSNSTASIEYTDLIEILKAIKALKVEVDKDIVLNPDYLENKFISVDGFQVGYYVSKNKATWYIKLDKYGSDNTLFIDNGEIIEVAFNDAKNKIEELKK